MDEKQKPVCGLCQRHQKLETVDGMAFWIEWDENGRSEERRVGKECRSRWSPYH